MVKVVHLAPKIFNPVNPTNVGGGERYPLELARAMARKVPTKLVSFGAAEQRWTEGSLEIEIVRPGAYLRPGFNPMSLAHLRRLSDATVVHCHQHHYLATNLASLWGHLNKKLTVLTDHGGGALSPSRLIQWGRLYDGFAGVSQFSIDILGVRCRRSAVILGGTHIPNPPVYPRSPEVTFVGRMLPHKGIEFLCQAAEDDTQINVVGPIWNREYFDHLKQVSSGKRVRFITEASDTEVAEIMRRSSCVVLPSVYQDWFGTHHSKPELLGLVLIEAMANGTPVIGSAVGGVPEVFTDGVEGFVVPPGDVTAIRSRLKELLSSPALVEQMGQAGRKRAERLLSWEAIADQCLSFYQELNSTR